MHSARDVAKKNPGHQHTPDAGVSLFRHHSAILLKATLEEDQEKRARMIRNIQPSGWNMEVLPFAEKPT
jgi:hypothetical protein